MLMEVDPTQALEFDFDLVPAGSRAIPVNDLKERLTILQEQLQKLDQQTVDKESLDKVSKELIHSKTLRHKNSTVRALAACCLADILRLFAPEAPYSQRELSTLFSFFVNELRHLKDVDGENYRFYFYLLESLSTVKSIIIVADLSDAESLLSTIFATFFDLATRHLPRNAQVCLTDLLIQLLEEIGSLPQDAVELVLEQFEKESEDPAYTMALELCQACSNVLQRRVCQYFTDALVAMSRSSGVEEDVADLRKVHRLIQRVHSVVPDLLLNVIPQLEEEMKLNDDTVRLVSIETIGAMLAEPNSSLFQEYPSVWKTWLGRRNDKSAQIRITWIQKCAPILEGQQQDTVELNSCIRNKLADPEDKVRSAACTMLGELSISSVVAFVDRSVLEELAMRCKDKKRTVRQAAMTALGSIYHRSCSDMMDADEDRIAEKVDWIPDTLLKCLYVDDLSVTATLENTLRLYIIPESLGKEEWSKRLLKVVQSLDSRGQVAFRALNTKQKSVKVLVQKLLDLYEHEFESDFETDTYEQDDYKQRLEAMIKRVSSHFPDAAKMATALRRFPELEEKTCLDLLRQCVSLESDCEQVVEYREKLAEELRDNGLAFTQEFESLINKAAPLLLNKSCILYLLEQLREFSTESTSSKASAALFILKEIANVYPSMYDSYSQDLITSIATETNDIILDSSLELLAQICSAGTQSNLYTEDFLTRLHDLMQQNNQQRAKYASIIMANISEDSTRSAAIERLCQSLSEDNPNLMVSLTCLAEFAVQTPAQLEAHIPELLELMETKVLPKSTPAPDEENRIWIPYEELPNSSKEKVTGMHLLVNFLASTPDHDKEDFVVDRIFALLWDWLDTTADMATSAGLCAAEVSHLRLTAASAIIKLTHMQDYQHELNVPKFEKLGLILQDACYDVREGAADMMMRGIQTGQMHPRYFALLFLCAHEPETSLLKRVKYFIQKRAAAASNPTAHTHIVEHSFVQLIHTLAHHPDYGIATEDLVDFPPYIEFFLSCIANADNVAFLYHVAQKIKSSKDMVATELSQNSYVLSELASYMIKRKCEDMSWPLSAYPQKVSLQSKLYKALPAGSIQTETMKQNYLPDAFLRKYEESRTSKGEKRSATGNANESKRVRAA